MPELGVCREPSTGVVAALRRGGVGFYGGFRQWSDRHSRRRAFVRGVLRQQPSGSPWSDATVRGLEQAQSTHVCVSYSHGSRPALRRRSSMIRHACQLVTGRACVGAQGASTLHDIEGEHFRWTF
jgi:hypothetical protein